MVQWEHPSLDEISLAAANQSSGLKDHVKNLGSKNPFYSGLDGLNGLQTPCFVGLIITVPVMLMFLTYKEKSTPQMFLFYFIEFILIVMCSKFMMGLMYKM